MVAQPRSPSAARRTLAGLLFALRTVLRAAPGLLAADAAITLAEALAPLATLQGTRALLDALAAGRSPWSGLAWLALGAAIPAFGSRVVYGPVGAALNRRVETALRPRIMAALATMPWSRLEDPASQDRLARAEDGMVAVTVLYDSGAALIRDAGRGASALAFLLTVSPWAALCAAAALGPSILLQRAAAAEWESARLAQIPSRRLAGYLFGLLTGAAAAAEVRIFGSARYIASQWLDASRRSQRTEQAEQARTALRNLSAAAGGAALMLLAAALVVLGGGGAGATASGITGLMTAFEQTADLSFWAGSLAQEGLEAANLAEILAWGRPLRPWPRPSRLRRARAAAAGTARWVRGGDEPGPGVPAGSGAAVAALRGVTFTYPGSGAPAVRDLTLEVRGGERLALVGRNGSGKSTAVKLLLGLLEPDAGKAIVPPRAGVALQDFGRYALTAAENVGLGRPSRMGGRARIAAAMARSGLALAPEQPLGRHRPGGLEPSGGQWQRLALARALHSGAPLLVLDEPAAALDPLAEAALYADFARLAASRTAVLVTHRLAAARIADRVAVFEDGRVVQQGTHAELVADRTGLYARMWAAQSGWARP